MRSCALTQPNTSVDIDVLTVGIACG
jgi:hypothetical protein